MKTIIGKCLVVVTAVAALMVMGIALASAVGGRNWNAETRDLPDYVFEKSGGETVTWTVKDRRTGSEIKSSPVLAETILAAHRDRESLYSDELAEVQEDITSLEAQIAEQKQHIETDLKALASREEQLSAEVQSLNQQAIDAANDAVSQSQEAFATRVEAEKRRQDVMRLQAQLEEIRADRFRAEQQRKALQDSLVRLEGTIDRLQRRNHQLSP